MTQATPRSCACCLLRDPRRPQVCDLCRHRLAARLWELRDLWSLLPAALQPGQSAQQRVSGSREPPVPLRIPALDHAAPAHPDAVTDPWQDQTGAVSVATLLDSWARDWADHLDLPAPTPDVPLLVSWLARNLPSACDTHPAMDDFAMEVTHALYAVRAMLNVSRQPIYLPDPCPSCGHTALKRDPAGGEDVECGHCRRSWPWTQFRRLAVVLSDEASSTRPASSAENPTANRA